MSLQNKFEDLKIFDEGVRDCITESNRNSLTQSSIQKILHYIHTGNYLQIFYSYGKEILTELLDYFLSIENYIQCSLIRDTVKDHNKATGENIKLI